MVYSIEDINKYINRYGKSYGIHISVYPFSTVEENKPDYESAIIDKIFIDIDSSNWLAYARDIFNWCEEKDIICRFNMSGFGCHFFIFCKETIRFKKNCIFNFQTYLEKKLHIEIDPQTKGDLSRTFRLPNTYNHKRNRFCIPLTKEDLFGQTEK